jgi:hypothetical protein
MSITEDDKIMSDDDEVPLMHSRYGSTRDQSIQSTVRSEPMMTSTMASSPHRPLGPNLTIHVPPTPAKEKVPLTPAKEKIPITPEQSLNKQLAASKRETQWQHDDKLRIKKARALERKEIGKLKEEKRDLCTKLRGKDVELKEKDGRIKDEQEQRMALSKAYDELVRQLEVAKRNLGAGGMKLVQQVNEKDREIQRLNGEVAKGGLAAQEIEKLNRECAMRKATVGSRNQEIEDMKAVRAKERASLSDKTRKVEKLKGELAEKQGNTGGNPMLQNLMLELQKMQASLMAPVAPPPKTADRGVEMGTQTDDDGLAEKMAAIKRMFG